MTRSPRTGPPSASSPVVVLLTLSPPDGTTRYVDQVVSDTPEWLTYRYFSWRHALLGRHDVLHVHWPELTIRARRPAKAWLRRRALDLYLLRARATGIAVVRTVHNERPHEPGGRGETRSLRRLDSATTLAIVLTPSTRVPAGVPSVHIPHGHYRDRFSPGPVTTVPGRLLFFGLIRRYKGVDHLVDVFRSVPDPSLELRIVGRPSAALRPAVEEWIAGADRVTARLDFVPDDDLIDEIGRADVVVLPYQDLLNSGAVLVALSLGRPVLIPDGPPARDLAAEVGDGWVRTYRGPLTAQDLIDAVTDARRTSPRPPPRFAGRSWPEVAERTRAAYLEAIGLARAETNGRR